MRQFDLAGADPFQIEDVVNETDETIGIADCDLQHPFPLLLEWAEQPAAKEAKCSTNGREGRSELVTDRRNELALESFDGAALGHIAENHHRPTLGSVFIEHRFGGVLDGKARTIQPPEGVVHELE